VYNNYIKDNLVYINKKDFLDNKIVNIKYKYLNNYINKLECNNKSYLFKI
jgi:hypothetical protein